MQVFQEKTDMQKVSHPRLQNRVGWDISMFMRMSFYRCRTLRGKEYHLLLSIIVDTKNSKNAPNHAAVL